MIKNVTTYVERNGEEYEVEVEFTCSWDSGEYLEPNHPCNGYGEGYDYDDFSYSCPDLPDLKMTPKEIDEAWKRVHFSR